jgi:hypothetical protein
LRKPAAAALVAADPSFRLRPARASIDPGAAVMTRPPFAKHCFFLIGARVAAAAPVVAGTAGRRRAPIVRRHDEASVCRTMRVAG